MSLENVGPAAARDRESLLGLRVSEVLELHDGALDVLVAHGFAPLAQTHLRALLAPTVTLSQAMRLRSLPESARASLLDELQGLLARGSFEPPTTGEEEPRGQDDQAAAAGLGAACH